MEEIEDRFVFPGDKIGTHEEWMPGEGTYEEDGFIYAKVFGEVEYDEDELEARVSALNPITLVEVGDVVYGTIQDRRESIATMDIELVEGESRSIRVELEGTIHISKVSDDYTENLEDEFLKGDIVRAKVIQIDPSIQLRTNGSKFGVVQGNCFNCRRGMQREGNRLYCSACDRREKRKISDLYGKIKLKNR